MKLFLNKSFLTNIAAALFVGGSYLFPHYQSLLANIGCFALSGSVTNWIAIQMLFEKIPGFYGSGIIPNKFEEFKKGIRNLMMDQFFTRDNLERFFKEQTGPQMDLSQFLNLVDYDLLFAKLKTGVMDSPFGAMLGMFGGEDALDQMKAPMIEKISEAIHEMGSSPAFKQKLAQTLEATLHIDQLLDRVDYIVQARLDELTPHMVKEIIQEMIKEHLGWLVVWGGFFGGLMGLIASFVTS